MQQQKIKTQNWRRSCSAPAGNVALWKKHETQLSLTNRATHLCKCNSVAETPFVMLSPPNLVVTSKDVEPPKLGIAWMEGVTDPINTPLPTRVTGRICFVVRSNGTSVTKICLKSLASHLPHLKVTQGHRNQRFNRLTFHIATTFLSRIYRFRNKRRFLS